MTVPVRVVVHHTLVELDLNHPRTARVLADAQELHRLVMSMFRHWVTDGQPNARALMGVLHTSAVDLSQRTLTLIVQSLVPPDTRALPRHMLTTPAQTRIVTLTVKAGQEYLFRTTITPAVYGHHNGRRTRDRPTDTSPAAALTWLTQRLQPDPAVDYDRHPLIGADARPEHLKARKLPALAAHRPGQPVPVARSEIQGRLTVTDPAAFARTLTQGLGRQRAYGCGLLLVQLLPAPRTATPTERQPCSRTTDRSFPAQSTQTNSPTSSPAPSTPSPSTASALPTPATPPGPSISTTTTSGPCTTTPDPAGTSSTPTNTTPASTTPSAPYAGPPPGPMPVPAQPNGLTTSSTPRACASSTSKPPASTNPEPSTSPSAPQTASSSTH
ncbi:type I-E CRISPR-associated protein Cas6/Cse3/CasE [Streptomyces sp. NPDC048352]|uniref:type I-E CRISPR-associated protein Cas6/Cse3/CasE n=1 Tax=Streptomyces sp. NPDC048352 TaxID=3154718 RepID=UPI0034193EC3